MDKHFGGVIWTNHVLQRLKERNISQSDAWATWKNPISSRYSKTKGAWIYQRTIGDKILEVVAKKNDRNEWIIMSVWSKPYNGAKLNKNNKTFNKPGTVIYLFFFFLMLVVFFFVVLSFLA